MTTATRITINEKRSNEIWCSAGGNIHCVSQNCMGFNMFSEISNNLRQAKTWDGGYRFTEAERTEFRDFMVTEMGDSNPTCECGRLAI